MNAPSPGRVVARATHTLAAALVALCAWQVGVAETPVRTTDPVADGLKRLERVWTLVDERYWDLSTVPVDWDRVRDRYRAALRTEARDDPGAVDRILMRMVNELADDHSRFVPPDEVERVREAYGDLPCIGVFADRPVPAPWLGSRTEHGRAGPVAWRVEDRLGVITVEDLARSGTSAGVRTAVQAAERAGAEALVLDLRGNPGGRLVEMMTTAGVFVRGFLWRVVTRWS
ncbi:MAG: S41 family peptidase, partial [Trueperaceae bacterium]